MRTPVPSALVRPLHRDLVAFLTPELGERAALQVSSHALTVISYERCDALAVLRGMLAICHREEHGAGPELSTCEVWKLAAECYQKISATLIAHDLIVRLVAVRVAGHREVAA